MKIGKLELVLAGIIALCVYALAVKGRGHRAAVPAPRDDEPPAQVAEPDPPQAEPEPAPPDEPTPTEVAADPPADEPAGTEIDAGAVAAAVAKVKADVAGCGRRHPATGIVRTRVQIAPDGRPTTVAITETPDAALGQCVARAMQKLRLPASARGAMFNYPFQFQAR